ncbi:MAG: metalloregulator ArsR/SmtB family transcription factor [Bryobacteraceae bacterium]|nr:metalloregulator ArsR/SmtB family transcription factor [Bryobacteraceae bacterium]
MDRLIKRQFKDELFGQFARIGKALSSGRRLELIELLAQRERTVEELARATGMSVANCSQHLQVLRNAALVSVRREGLYAHYGLSDESVLRLWLSMRSVGESRLADITRVVDTFLTDRKSLEAISCAELNQRLRKGTVTVLDVRPVEEYEAGHIAGARSIPVAELKRRLKEIPKGKMIVAYCRGPYCVLTDEAVKLLSAQGYKVVRLEEGFPDWKIMGLPMASGARA